MNTFKTVTAHFGSFKHSGQIRGLWLLHHQLAERHVHALLSLVELLHYCALIGREIFSDETFSYTRGISCFSLVLYDIRIGGFHTGK